MAPCTRTQQIAGRHNHRQNKCRTTLSATQRTSLSCIRCPFHFALDVVPLAEEREPVIQHLLMFIREVGPFGSALCSPSAQRLSPLDCTLSIRPHLNLLRDDWTASGPAQRWRRQRTLGLQTRLRERARRVLAGEDAVRALGPVSLVAADVEDGALDVRNIHLVSSSLSAMNELGGLVRDETDLDGDVGRIVRVRAWHLIRISR